MPISWVISIISKSFGIGALSLLIALWLAGIINGVDYWWTFGFVPIIIGSSINIYGALSHMRQTR